LRKEVTEMNYEELKTKCKDYVSADKKHKELLAKYFPCIWNNAPLPRPISIITRKDIDILKKVREAKEKAENEWYASIIEFSKNRK